MRQHRIQHRIILLFVLFAVAVFLISGWTLQWMIRQSLEAELGRKLTAVASAAAILLSEEEIDYLRRGLGPRATQRLRQSLLDLQDRTSLKRIYFFDLDGRSLLDTEDVAAGEPYYQLRFYQREMEAIRAGSTAHTILFRDIHDRPAMTGLAPLITAGKTVGGVGVEGSATFLDALGRLQTRLYVIGLLGALAAVLLGALLARTITRPVNALVAASRKIGSGDYSETIAVQSRDEIGTLAATMEDMRKSVLERERELKAMLAGVAHEIRNPLGGIELFVGLLSDHVAADAEPKKHVQRIAREVAQLKGIVESFLEYARPKSPTPEPCSLDGLLRETASLLDSQMTSRDIALSIEPPDPDPPVEADPQHLKRIFLNLLRNALQAVPDGGKIRIWWQQAGREVKVTLADTGSGIPPEAAGRIFDPFFTTRQSGTGLGLAIVKTLVEANGGSIQLVRSGQDGTIFDIMLRRANGSEWRPSS
jgi:signal transduction histidine kinase